MERVKINLPQQFGFTTNLDIRISEVNYGGHVGNDSFLSLIQEARLQYLKQFGYSEIDLGGCGLIMMDAAIEFKAELFYGDKLSISVAVSNITRVGFDLFYLLEKTTDGETKIAGKAKTGMICFDYISKKVMPVPEAFIQKIKV